MSTKRIAITVLAIVAATLILIVYRHERGTTSIEAIKIGQMSGLTGIGSDVGTEERNGALLAIEEINATGGIAGKKLEMISEDTPPFDPRKGASAAQKLIATDQVVAIVGPQWDTQGEVMAAISSQQKVPVVSQNVSTDIESKVNSPYFFVTWPDDEIGVRAVLQYAQSRGWKKIAIIEPANFSFWLFTANLMVKDASDYGITIVAKEMGSDFNNVDYRTLISKAKAAKSDAVFGSYADLECIFLKQSKEQGLNVPLLSTDSALNIKALSDCGTDMEGKLYFSTLNHGNGFSGFVERYQTRFGQKPLVSSAATAYNAVLVLADVMKKLAAEGKDIDRENVRAGLAAEKFDNGVATKNIQFNDKGFVITQPDAYEMQTVVGGKFVEAK